MKKINSAIIGCGAIYRLHADAIKQSKYSNLVAVVDIEEQKAKSAATDYECKHFTDYKEVLLSSDIEVVHICTPHYLHASMAIEALKAGKHVLVEKPIARDVSQAQQLVQEAKKNSKYLGVCFQNRYNNTSIKIKEMLDQEVLGKIKGIKGIVAWNRDEAYYTESNWRGSWETEGGGVLINQSIHTLDLMQWFGGEIEHIEGHVSTRVLKHIIEVEDTADATIYFRNGAVGIFYATNCHTTNSPVEIEIHCEQGVLKIDDGDLLLKKDGQKQCLVSDTCSNGSKAYWGISHCNLIEQFYNSIINKNHKGFINGSEGVIALEMIDRIYKSSASGNKIKF